MTRRETDKQRREREAYEAAIAAQREHPGARAVVPPLVDSGGWRPASPIIDEREALHAQERRAPAASVTLPPEKLARRSDVETSHAAAEHAAETRETQRSSIMALHREHPNGLTDDEVSVLLGDEVWRRCADLRTLGLLTWKLVQHPNGPTGVLIPATRVARSGRQARVSIVNEPAP